MYLKGSKSRLNKNKVVACDPANALCQLHVRNPRHFGEGSVRYHVGVDADDKMNFILFIFFMDVYGLFTCFWSVFVIMPTFLKENVQILFVQSNRTGIGSTEALLRNSDSNL